MQTDGEWLTAERLFNSGDAAGAVPHYRRALLFKPVNRKIHLRLAQCEERLGRDVAAFDTLDRLVRESEDLDEETLREALLSLTNLCHRLEKPQRVVDALQLHPDLVRNTPALAYNLGLGYFKQQKFAQASNTFVRLREDHAKHAAGYMGLAIVAVHFGKNEEAVSCLESARHAASWDPQVIENLAVVQMKAGNPVAAITSLRAGLNRFLKNPKLLHLMGVAHLQIGEAPKAEHYLRSSLERNRTSETLREMGRLLIRRKAYIESIAFLKESLSMDSENTWTKADLAVAYHRQGMIADAAAMVADIRRSCPSREIENILDDLTRVQANAQS